MSSALCFNDNEPSNAIDTSPDSSPSLEPNPFSFHNDSNLANHKLTFEPSFNPQLSSLSDSPYYLTPTNFSQPATIPTANPRSDQDLASFSRSESRTRPTLYSSRPLVKSRVSGRRRNGPRAQFSYHEPVKSDPDDSEETYREQVTKVVRPRFPHPKGSVFIPVAAYSITKRRPSSSNKKKSQWAPSSVSRSWSSPSLAYHRHRSHRPQASSSSSRHRIVPSPSRYRPKPYPVPSDEDDLPAGQDDEDLDEEESGNEEDYETRKESAVYGYLRKPEIIEFRGQYYYGNGATDGTVPVDGDTAAMTLDQQQQMMEQQPSIANKYDTKVDYQDQDAGQNQQVALNYQKHRIQPQYHHRHRVSGYMPAYESAEHFDTSFFTSNLILKKIKKILFVKGLTIKGLLLASLPLVLTPVLSYLLTPVVIPITANVAAGRRRRRRRRSLPIDSFGQLIPNQTNSNSMSPPSSSHFVPSNLNHHRSNSKRIHQIDSKLFDAKVLFEYLGQPGVNNRLDNKSQQQQLWWTSNAVASFLQCRGFLQPNDHCLEQLACQFAVSERELLRNKDLRKSPQQQPPTTSITSSDDLERSLTSMILGHLLRNQFIRGKFKKRLKLAAQTGRLMGSGGSRQCPSKYPCSRTANWGHRQVV